MTPNDDLGILERGLIRWFGKNFKTTVPGLLATVCTPIIIVDQFVVHPMLHTAAAICGALVAASAGAIGIGSKANNVTGAGVATRVVVTPAK